MKKDDELLIKLNEKYPWLYSGNYWGITLNDYLAQMNRILAKENTKMLPYSASDPYTTDILDTYKDVYTGCTNFFVNDTVAVLACLFQPSYDVIICMHPFCTENDNSAISDRIFTSSFAKALDFVKTNAKSILDDKRHVGFKV